MAARFPDIDNDDYFESGDNDPSLFENYDLSFLSRLYHLNENDSGVFYNQAWSINDYISNDKNYIIGHYGRKWFFRGEYDDNDNVSYTYLQHSIGNGSKDSSGKLVGPGFRETTISDVVDLGVTDFRKKYIDALSDVIVDGGSPGVIFFNDKCTNQAFKSKVSPKELGQSYKSGHSDISHNQINIRSIGQDLRDDLQVGFSSVYLAPGMRLSFSYGNRRVVSTKYTEATDYRTGKFNNVLDYMAADEYHKRFVNDDDVEFDGFIFDEAAGTTGRLIDMGAVMTLYHQYDILGSAHWVDNGNSTWDDIVKAFGGSGPDYQTIGFMPSTCCKPARATKMYSISSITVSKNVFTSYNDMMFGVCSPFTSGIRLLSSYQPIPEWAPKSFNCDALMTNFCNNSLDPICGCFNEQKELDSTYGFLDYPVLAPCVGSTCGSSSVYKTKNMDNVGKNCSDICVQLLEQSGSDIIQESSQLATCGGATYTQSGGVSNSLSQFNEFNPLIVEKIDISNYLFIGAGSFLAVIIIIILSLWLINK